MKIRFIKTKPEAKTPSVAYNNESACFDLFSLQTVEIEPYSRAIFDIGIKIIIPKGHYLRFNDRSGLGFKKGIKCHQGIIDYGYTGDMGVLLWNTTNQKVVIAEGEAIVQVELLKTCKKIFIEASEKEWNEYYKKSLRKNNGFGSSNK